MKHFSESERQSAYQKLEKLRNYLKELGGVVVAFSSGVDSTFLLYVAHEQLGEKVLAVTAHSCSFPEREAKEADVFCEKYGIRHEIVDSEELNIPGFRQNPVNRCYLCKRELFEEMLKKAKEHGLPYVAEGSNMDDNGDYRPGLQAIAELGIKSPLRHARLYKEEIRFLSKEMGLPTWDKQSFACLSSRFVYGETISEDRLKRVELAEQFLLDQGFHQVRVRIHGEMARIEVAPDEIDCFLKRGLREETAGKLKEFGFSYVTLDLEGYRTGSMNQGINV